MAEGGDRRTESGIEVKPVYTAADAPRELEPPGEYPVHPRAYRRHVPRPAVDDAPVRGLRRRPRRRTRASATCSSAARPGSRSPSTCRPSSATTPTTRCARGEVGRIGVAIDSLDDMEILLDGIPLGDVSTSMTINAPGVDAAAALRAGRGGAGRRAGRSCAARSRTTSSRSTSRAATTSSRRGPRCASTTDTVRATAPSGCRAGTRSRSRGYHIREAGSTAVQELAFTLANGIAYVEAAVAAGLAGRRLRRARCRSSSTPTTTSSRRSRSSARRGGCGPRSCASASARRTRARSMLRFHAQTGGSTLTAQQPENNVVRVAIQALSAVCGGAQSLHTNSFDEALALPDRARGARSRCAPSRSSPRRPATTETADPLGGSLLHRVADRRARGRAWELIAAIDEARRRRRRGRVRLRAG